VRRTRLTGGCDHSRDRERRGRRVPCVSGAALADARSPLANTRPRSCIDETRRGPRWRSALVPSDRSRTRPVRTDAGRARPTTLGRGKGKRAGGDADRPGRVEVAERKSGTVRSVPLAPPRLSRLRVRTQSTSVRP
jgi:hypothetical protein